MRAISSFGGKEVTANLNYTSNYEEANSSAAEHFLRVEGSRREEAGHLSNIIFTRMFAGMSWMGKK